MSDINRETSNGRDNSSHLHLNEFKTRYRPSTSDETALMELLSTSLPLVEAAISTRELLDCYDSYADILAAPLSELRMFNCLGEHGPQILKSVHMAAMHLAAAPLQQTTSVNDWKSLSAYLNTSMSREKSEILRVLFLNSRNYVISDEMLMQGTLQFVTVSTREMITKAIQCGATSVLLIHNHPSGDPTPSSEDFNTTFKIEKALDLMGILLHDHVIVGKGRFFSIKRLEYISYPDGITTDLSHACRD